MFDAVGDVERAVGKLLASEDPVDVARVNKIRNQIDCARLRAIDDYVRSGAWREQYATAATAVRSICNCSRGAAKRDVVLAAKLRDLPIVEEAFAVGDISLQHVAVITDVYTPERAAAVAEVEEYLVQVARLASPQELRPIVDRIRGALDGDDGTERANAQNDRRKLHLSTLLDGMGKLDGWFDPEATMLIRQCLDRVVEQIRAAGDSRNATQLRADALVEVVRRANSHTEPDHRRANVPDITVCMDLADIAGDTPDVAEAIRNEGRHHTGLSRETLRRLTCDCRISRVITDGASQVLDVGRATRTIPVALWKALVARDQGCTDCGAPPGQCEVHHVVHWANGGPTNLDNTRLKCHSDHRHAHEGRDRSPP